MKSDKKNQRDVGSLAGLSFLKWAKKHSGSLLDFTRMGWNLFIAKRKQKINEKWYSCSIPTVIAFSPTMKCNYNCIGCYSRGRDIEDEFTPEEIDLLFSEAEKLGVLSFVLTGGEPFMAKSLLNIVKKHPKLLFILITNGSLIVDSNIKLIRECKNLTILISIEGSRDYTDRRRITGAYSNSIKAMRLLEKAGKFYGFAATSTAKNIHILGSDDFIDRMISLGCSVGYYTEYVPCGENPREDWLLTEEERQTFRERVLELKRSKEIVLIHFPHDEYGPENKCKAAGIASLHISSQGEVEPCPFVPVSCDNVREKGLTGVCKSKFLKVIREHPSLLRREEFACALFENYEELLKISQKFTEK